MFVEYVRLERKNKTYTIGRLKDIWLGESYGKIMRILYAYFLRKRSLHYIYSSKIENKASHAKYKQKLLDSLAEPSSFNSFKWATPHIDFFISYFRTGQSSFIIG